MELKFTYEQIRTLLNVFHVHEIGKIFYLQYIEIDKYILSKDRIFAGIGYVRNATFTRMTLFLPTSKADLNPLPNASQHLPLHNLDLLVFHKVEHQIEHYYQSLDLQFPLNFLLDFPNMASHFLLWRTVNKALSSSSSATTLVVFMGFHWVFRLGDTLNF